MEQDFIMTLLIRICPILDRFDWFDDDKADKDMYNFEQSWLSVKVHGIWDKDRVRTKFDSDSADIIMYDYR